MNAKQYLPLVLAVGLCLDMFVPRTAAQTQGFEQSCFSTTIASVPSRPTVSNGADTTQCGVLEAEYGFERQWLGGVTRQDDLSGGLRLGLTPHLDFHWSSGDFLNLVNDSGARTGFGDTWLGLKYRFLSQTKFRPSFGVFYQAKLPSAVEGFGSGEVDHAISFLVSKDVHRFHLDFNVTPVWAGCKEASGVDHNTGLALSFSVPLTQRLALIGEGYGYTFLNQENPSFASTMAGLTYQVKPRFLLDAGIDIGASADARGKRIFAGATYAVGNLYAWLRPRQ